MTVKIIIVDRIQSDEDCSHAQPTWSSDADDNGSFDDRDFCVTAQLADGQVKLPDGIGGAQLSPDRAIELVKLIASAAKEVKDYDDLMLNSTYEERELKLESSSGKTWHEKYEDRTFYRNKDILD
mgnify:CR=1 FL=1